MTPFKAFFLLNLFLAAIPASAQQVLFFEGQPTVRELFEEIGIAPRTRSFGGTPRALLNPQTGGRFDSPGAQPKTSTASKPKVTAPAPVPARVPDIVPPLLGGNWIAALVQFEINAAEIQGSEFAMLDVVGKALKEKPELKVIVSGHADKSGGDAINRPLSLRRAKAVSNFLASKYGVTADRIVIRGASADEPLDGLGEFHPKNRRVQFGFFMDT